MSAVDVEERPKPTPGVISDITIVPFKGPDAPFKDTVQAAVTFVDVTSTREVPCNGMLPVKTTPDISIVSVRLFIVTYAPS